MSNYSSIIHVKMLKGCIITVTFFILVTSAGGTPVWTEDIDGQREIINQFAGKVVVNNEEQFQGRSKSPVTISGENVYTAWWTNITSNNEEVIFRASIDGGQTFGDKINLSNTTDADSSRVEIAADDEKVVVSWWEANQTDDIPVARVSTDNGQTFGPHLRLANNGSISGDGGGGSGGGE